MQLFRLYLIPKSSYLVEVLGQRDSNAFLVSTGTKKRERLKPAAFATDSAPKTSRSRKQSSRSSARNETTNGNDPPKSFTTPSNHECNNKPSPINPPMKGNLMFLARSERLELPTV
jgi:hypothetical protein